MRFMLALWLSAMSCCAQLIGMNQIAAPAASGGGGGSITFIQSTNRAAAASVSSLSIAFNSANTAGNMIIVGVYFGAQSVSPTVTDTQGNTYGSADNATNQVTDGHETCVFHSSNIHAGANTVTVSFGASYAFNAITVAEVSVVSALDKTAAAQNNGSTSPSSGNTATTTAANEFLFGHIGGSGASGGATPEAGWTAICTNTIGGGFTSFAEYKIVSSTGAYAATATLDQANDSDTIIATYK